MNVEAIDSLMMGHCIGLSKASGKAGEYPYAAVICRDGMIVAESINKVTHDGDVTRHAEVAAISQAQKTLGIVSLEDWSLVPFVPTRSARPASAAWSTG
jgi:tRNA(adenine34) deaminase